MDLDFILLITEILLDVVCLVLGVILICKAETNRPRLVWGIITISYSIWLLHDNFSYLFKSPAFEESKYELLLFRRMLKWLVITTIIPLFPIASLKPGWLTTFRITLLTIPFAAVMIVSLCYLWFNGYTTPLYSIKDISDNIGMLDVKVRLFIFIFTVLIPGLYFSFPLFDRWIIIKRNYSRIMKLYIGISVLMLCFHIIYSFSPEYIFDYYGHITALILILYSIFFIEYENPLSMIKQTTVSQNSINRDEPVAPAVLSVYNKMITIMSDKKPFISPGFSYENLITSLESNRTLTAKAIQYAGFTGFREYISYQRHLYFKELAKKSPGASIKDLMFRSGFTSSSSFYRQFTKYENISPKDYIENLYNKLCS